MPSVAHSFDATCSTDALWAVLADIWSVGRTNPLVKSVVVTGPVHRGLNATRRCELLPKGVVVERVCRFEEGRAIGFEVVESDWPVRSMSWTTVVEPTANGAKLLQTLDYRMKFGPLGWLLNALILRRAIESNVGKALLGVIREAEGR
jgi:hypothetical protein